MTKKALGGICVVLVAGILTLTAGIGSSWFTNGNIKTWFNSWGKGKQEVVQPEEPDGSSAGANGAFITNGESHGIKLMSAEIPQSAYEANGVSELADTAFTLTARVEPLGATDYFEWTVSNNDDEAITIAVSADRSSAVVTCNKAFSVQKVITVTSTVNASVKASCTVDYYKRLQSVSFEMPTIKLYTTSTTYTLSPKAVYGVGTVADTVVTVTGGDIKLNNNLYSTYNNFGGSVKLDQTVTFTGNSFSLIMSPNSQPSFCNKATSGDAKTMYAGVFKNFVGELSNPNSAVHKYAQGEHYTINVEWTAKRNGTTIDSGTVKVRGEIDASALVVDASDVTLSDTNILF